MTETVELDAPPSLSSLYARALTGAVVPGGGDGELPDCELVLRGIEIDPAHVAEYNRVCGFGMRDTVPATYPHLPAFPLHLRLMTERSFPFGAMGLVHIANRIELVSAISVGATLDLSLHAEDLRPHPKGRQFDMIAEATADGEPAWRSRSVYLRRGNGDGEEEEPSEAERATEAADLDVSAIWKVPGDVGRRYAGVSGDRNPIHMHPLSARLFGFPTTIAHGMWMKARCLAAFEGRLPETYSVEVEFRSPLRIPGRALFLSGRTDSGYAFRLETPDREHTHVVGAIAER